MIDTELALLSNGAVTTDGVVNDSVFQSQFPYLGTPNPKPFMITPVKPTLTHKPKGKQKKASVQAKVQPLAPKIQPVQQLRGKK